VILCDNDVEMM